MSSAAGEQQHPLRVYLAIWLLLFVLSIFSYLVDFFQLQGYLRWALILLFMFLKAGLIISIFMHMAWERLALVSAILVPPCVLIVLIALMSVEGIYTFNARVNYFGADPNAEPLSPGLHH
jgi:cytochrome c oxidase subunit 4